MSLRPKHAIKNNTEKHGSVVSSLFKGKKMMGAVKPKGLAKSKVKS